LQNGKIPVATDSLSFPKPPNAMSPEPFVSAEEAARFLSVSRRYLLTLARKGLSGAYALGTGTERKIWVFRLSELASAIAGDPQNASTVRSSRQGNLHAGRRTS
jgi:excisionase family DNA binding protein